MSVGCHPCSNKVNPSRYLVRNADDRFSVPIAGSGHGQGDQVNRGNVDSCFYLELGDVQNTVEKLSTS